MLIYPRVEHNRTDSEGTAGDGFTPGKYYSAQYGSYHYYSKRDTENRRTAA